MLPSSSSLTISQQISVVQVDQVLHSFFLCSQFVVPIVYIARNRIVQNCLIHRYRHVLPTNMVQRRCSRFDEFPPNHPIHRTHNRHHAGTMRQRMGQQEGAMLMSPMTTTTTSAEQTQFASIEESHHCDDLL